MYSLVLTYTKKQTDRPTNGGTDGRRDRQTLDELKLDSNASKLTYSWHFFVGYFELEDI